MRTIRFAALALAFSALVGTWAQSALADDAAAIFDPGTMNVVRLTLPQESREGGESGQIPAGDDVKPGEATKFEVDEGPEDNVADLEDLIKSSTVSPARAKAGPNTSPPRLTSPR